MGGPGGQKEGREREMEGRNHLQQGNLIERMGGRRNVIEIDRGEREQDHESPWFEVIDLSSYLRCFNVPAA